MKKKNNAILNLLKKYQDIIAYGFFGVCTTLVNVISYAIFARIGFTTISATVIAWVIAVLFAYVTNRKWVFKSKASGRNQILREILSFFACRLLTGVLDVGIMAVFVDRLGFNDVVIKTLSNILVIVINFIASKLIIFNSSKNKSVDFKKTVVMAISAVVILFFAFCVAEESQLGVWRGGEIGADSGVFKYIAHVINEGGMPYKDTFDHKGPLIYLINLMGEQLSYWRGVWVFELLSIIVTLYFMYRIFRLCNCSVMVASVGTLISASVLPSLIEGGNYTEEYAMPLIAVALYLFLYYLINKKFKAWHFFVSGVLCSAVLMLRINMVSVWAVFCIAIIVQCVKEKRVQELVSAIKWFILGLVVFATPIIIWLAANGAIISFIDNYILFNFSYASDGSLYGVSNAALAFFGKEVVMTALIISGYLAVKKKDTLSIVYIIYLALTAYTVCMSGRTYYHYLMIMVPALAYPVARFYGELKTNGKIISDAMLVFSFVLLAAPGILGTISHLATTYKERGMQHFDDVTQDVVGIINGSTDEGDLISVYGTWNEIYLLTGRESASKYSYQYTATIRPSIIDEYIADLEENKPKVVVVTPLKAGRGKVMDYLSKGYEKTYKNYHNPDDATRDVEVYIRIEN